MNKPTLMTPAVYCFFNTLTESTCKYHLASELFEAINNVIRNRGGKHFEPQEISKSFPLIRSKMEGGAYLCVNKEGDVSSLFPTQENWLEYLVKEEKFLPIEIGEQIMLDLQ